MCADRGSASDPAGPKVPVAGSQTSAEPDCAEAESAHDEDAAVGQGSRGVARPCLRERPGRAERARWIGSQTSAGAGR